MNGLRFDQDDAIDNQHGFNGTCFSRTDENQSKGFSCQEAFKLKKLDSGAPEYSSFSESQEDSDQDSTVDLFGFLNPQESPQNYYISEVPPKDEKTTKELPASQENTTRSPKDEKLVNGLPSTQEDTTQSETNPSSDLVNPNSIHNFNTLLNQNCVNESHMVMNGADMMEQDEENEGGELDAERNNETSGQIEIEPSQKADHAGVVNLEEQEEVKTNDGKMETEDEAETIQRMNHTDMNAANLEEEEKEELGLNAGGDDESSHSMQEEGVETDIEAGKRKVKPASKKRNLPSLLMVAVNKAYRYYRTPQKGQEKRALQSIQKVMDEYGNVDDELFEKLDDFIEGCNATLKTYKKCKLFINANQDRRVKQLFKRFILRIFEDENEEWLKGSATKNKQFFKELKDFSVAFSKNVFGIKVPPRKS